jgi:hypothetical protein
LKKTISKEMPNQDYKKEKIMLGVQSAAIAVLLVFYVFHAPALPPKPVTKTVVAKKPPVASKPKVRKHHKPARIAKRNKALATSQTQALQATPVLFPAPTEITIAVAAAPQLVKMDSYRNPLAADAKNWDCVKDVTTGLVWEVKTHDKGLQDANNYYSWYSKGILNPNGSGKRDNGKCRGGISCDTQSYINAINAKHVCGFSDWRLPTRKELLTLVRGHADGEQTSTIDTHFFPGAPGDWYWTADTDLGDSAHAWYVLFYNGRTMKALKSQAKRVRLVRGGTKQQQRSFKDMAEKKENSSNRKIAQQPFQPGSAATLEKELLSQN